MKRIVGVLFLILAVIATVNLVRQSGKPSSPRRSGSPAYERGQEIGRYAAPVLLFGLSFWLLFRSRPARQSGLSALAHPDYEDAPGTVASNPGRLQLNSNRWLAANPTIALIIGAMLLAGLGVAFLKVVPGIVLMGAGLYFGFQALHEARHKFRQGDVCPGVVLSNAAGLVAVITDLNTQGGPPCPAIKILRQPLHRMNPPATDGQRVAAVALYCGDVRAVVWNDFTPEVIDCVVSDPAEIARVVATIPEAQWQQLEAGLTRVPPAQPGLYPLGIERSETAPALPAASWWQRPRARLGVIVLGVGVAMLLIAVGLSWANNSRRSRPFPPGGAPSPTPPPQAFPAAGAKAAGGYQPGQKIEANWAGGWIPGTIIEPFGGGMSYRVQLEDSRFQYPMVLSTNRLRPQ